MRAELLCGVLVALLWLGCEHGDPCDPGQVYDHGGCTLASAAPDAGAEPDAATPEADAADTCQESLDDALGTTCSVDGECGCAAPYCAIRPGDAEGFCTVEGCTTEPDDCPPGYACFDLSQFGLEGYAPFCTAAD